MCITVLLPPPQIETEEEAQQAVMACRYPPLGNRSFGPIRGALYGGRGYALEANDQIACIAMIETAEGIANADEIMSTSGLNGIYIGPADLALSMGLPAMGDQPQDEHLVVVKELLEKCKKIMKSRLDEKMWYLYQHCFECQVEVENKLRISN